jgi:hypothetical protein
MKRLATPRVAGDLVNRGTVPTFLQKKTGRRFEQVVMPSFGFSRQAEYTPPVGYSESSRAKLVYKVEARPPLQQVPVLNPDQCQRIVYLADGRIVVQGAAAEVSAHSGLVIFEATGGDLDAEARRLRRAPGVEAAAVFGCTLRIAGTDRAALESAVRASDGAAPSWHEAEPRLEDVFAPALANVRGTPEPLPVRGPLRQAGQG